MVKEIQFGDRKMHGDRQPVSVHVGSQATGAEDLVVFLAANRAGLRRAGLGLYCFDVLPAGADAVADAMPDPGADADEAAAAAAALARRFAPDRKSGPEGFLLAAPDLAGTPAELLLGRFHPGARARARLLRQALGTAVDRLVLAVQPYEVLFHNIWMHLALERRIEPFADYADALVRFHGGWADLGLALAEELGAGEVVIQAAPMAPAQVLAVMAPGTVLRQPVQPLPRPRVTPSAVAMSQRFLAQGTRLQPGQKDRLLAFHARQPQIRPGGGFSTLALSELRGRYVADLDTLARVAGARVMGSPLAAMAAAE